MRPSRTAVRVALLLMSCALAASAAQAQTAAPVSRLAQEPLITKDPGIVEPNIVFTLDDSGSMAYNFLPDDDLRNNIGSNANVLHLFAYHPDEPDNADYVHYVQGLLSTSGRNVLGARRRSAGVNTLYYNPEVRYKPWMKADGRQFDESNPDASRMAPADPKAAYFHIGFRRDSRIAQLRIDLTKTVPKGKMPICASLRTQMDSKGRYPRCPGLANESEITPAVYFDFKWPGRDAVNPARSTPPTEADRNNLANYTRVVITDPGNTSFVRGNKRDDCTPQDVSRQTHVCTQAQELQNFANWYQYHRTRMHVAIAAVGEAFMTLPEHVRVGYGRINKLTETDIDGENNLVMEKGVRRFESSARQDFIAWLTATVPEGGTPLVNAMHRVGRYFTRRDDGGPWAEEPAARRRGAEGHLSCRRSYHVLMTDGMYNFEKDRSTRRTRDDFRDNADNERGNTITGVSKGAAAVYQYQPVAPYANPAAGALADYAMRYWKDDLRPDLPNNVPVTARNEAFWQHLTTHTLSFGVSGRLTDDDIPALKAGTKKWPNPIDEANGDTVDDLRHAAINSRGEYVNVQEGAGFYSHIQTLLGSITGSIGNTAGVAMSSQALQTGNIKFVPSFVTREWTGEITAYGVDHAGVQQAEVWRASQHLPEPQRRRLFVGKGETPDTVKAHEFTWQALPADLKTEMLTRAGVGDSAGENLIGWIRGSQTSEGGLFRRRKSIPSTRQATLGHFVNSTPAYVGAPIDRGYAFLPAQLPPGSDSGRDSYRKYVAGKAAGNKRPGTLFIGGNDGILHAFNEKTGVEVFGYIPRAVAGELAASSRVDFRSRFLLDGPLVERDAFLDGTWKNILVGSTGAGPAAVFALDVSDTQTRALQAQSLLWEINQAGQPALGHVMSAAEVGVTRDGRWVAIFGNGYESASRQAQLFVVDLKTGEAKILNTRVGNAQKPNGLGGVTVVRDGTQVITAVYAGDLHGNLWKFDLASEDRSRWKVAYDGSPLFTTDAGRPITAAPATVSHPAGGVMVLAGTGKLFENGDERDTSQEYIYGLWDNQKLRPMELARATPTSAARVDFRWTGGSPINSSSMLRHVAFVDRNREYATISATVPDWNTNRGWRLPLNMLEERGQRLIVQPLLVTGMVLFETMTPASEKSELQDACQEKLRNPAFSLLLDPLSGQMAEKAIIDTDGNQRINADDTVVGGWRVDDWTGRSVILTQPPPEPCRTNGCMAALRNPIVCDKGYLMSSAQGTRQNGVSICVKVPSASRWWWRELSVPDVSNKTNAVQPEPAADVSF